MVFKTLFGFALRTRGLALGWPPSIKSLVNPRMQVRLRLSITGRNSPQYIIIISFMAAFQFGSSKGWPKVFVHYPTGWPEDGSYLMQLAANESCVCERRQMIKLKRYKFKMTYK